MINDRYLIGFCSTTVQKEPLKPVLSELDKKIQDRDDYRMLVFHCYEDLYYDTPDTAGAAKLYDTICYDKLDAMLLLQVNEKQQPLFDRIYERCLEKGVPVISIDLNREKAFNINFDYGDAFNKIVEHVITKHGCKNIIHMAGMKENSFALTRIESCAKTMAEHGLKLEEENILYGDFWESPTYQAMDSFFASGRPIPDAFICANDSMAMAVCLKLAEQGYNVPEDVIVTGFDGIELEKYHNPRLTTAIRDHEELAAAIVGVLDRIMTEPGLEPYDVILEYKPVFSESCGCVQHDSAKSNHILADYVRKYNYARGYDEDMTTMCNRIAANPTLENARTILRKKSFGGTTLCITDDFYRYCNESSELEGTDINKVSAEYSDRMYVFTERNPSDAVYNGAEFLTKDILPDLMGSFDGSKTLFVMPIHSLEYPIGLFITYYVDSELYFDQTYSFAMATNRCLEMVRMHERMAFLNRKLEFMFTHDYLTKIYNRYGFYNNFRECYTRFENEIKDAFIVSIDMNDMKYINDNFGHHAGDDALRIIANALIMAAENDSEIICSRFGGDEFVVAKVCGGTAAQEAARYRDAFTAALGALNDTSGNPYRVNVSIGIYCASINAVDGVDELIELADRLMYSDKARYKRQPRNIP
ncbi:MAG: diguanylate cyclase domain-containing protein [Oscillospiraceae bacterium]